MKQQRFSGMPNGRVAGDNGDAATAATDAVGVARHFAMARAASAISRNIGDGSINN